MVSLAPNSQLAFAKYQAWLGECPSDFEGAINSATEHCESQSDVCELELLIMRQGQ